MTGVAVFVIGAALCAYGVAMLADWRSVGTQWALAVIRRTDWLYRREPKPSQPRVLRVLSRFGGTLAVGIGIGWMVAGAGFATGRLK